MECRDSRRLLSHEATIVKGRCKTIYFYGKWHGLKRRSGINTSGAQLRYRPRNMEAGSRMATSKPNAAQSHSPARLAKPF
jgi:hypothetical protein